VEHKFISSLQLESDARKI